MQLRHPRRKLVLDLTVWQTCALPLLLTMGVQAADPAAREPLRAQFEADARQQDFFADSEQRLKLLLEPKPIMRWSSDDDWYGDLFLWARDGRPQVIGCIGAGPVSDGRRLFFHEFHALTERCLPRQELSLDRVWASESPGVVFRPVEGAPVPAEGPAARLPQMRTIAREFEVHIDHNNSDWQLRLLPQPIYRYRQESAEEAASDWLDGSVFTYVLTTGTDAEVVLLLEARRQEEEFRWHYALARLTTRAAWAVWHENEVWRVDAHGEVDGIIDRPYTTFFVGSRVVDVEAKEP